MQICKLLSIELYHFAHILSFIKLNMHACNVPAGQCSVSTVKAEAPQRAQR